MACRAWTLALPMALLATAAGAQAIDPCSLLAGTDLAELGLPQDAVPSRESQPGGVQACKYRFPAAGAPSGGMVSVILSQAVPERVLQLRALQAQSLQGSTPAQQQARGEYVQGDVMCKVARMGQQEISQCVGAAGQSIVALTLARPSPGQAVAYPASQLQAIAALVARVAAKGG